MLLQMSFGNRRLAILSLLTLPMALVGGVLAATAGGGVISIWNVAKARPSDATVDASVPW